MSRHPADALALALVALGLLAGPASGQTRAEAQAKAQARMQARVPAKVEGVLKAIDETDRAPRGYLGGRPYENQARRGEQPLPTVDREGDPITYRTWDVDPETPGHSRGGERLVTGSDGAAYFTADAYRTFVTIRNPARSTLAGAVHAQPPTAVPVEKAAQPAATPGPPTGGLPIVTLDPRTAARVDPVVAYILAHHAPPPDHVGGRNYGNFGTDGGEVLPRTDADRRPIRYQEWDVNAKVPGRNRGAERIVTGSDGAVYYTNDHYATFQRIR